MPVAWPTTPPRPSRRRWERSPGKTAPRQRRCGALNGRSASAPVVSKTGSPRRTWRPLLRWWPGWAWLHARKVTDASRGRHVASRRDPRRTRQRPTREIAPWSGRRSQRRMGCPRIRVVPFFRADDTAFGELPCNLGRMFGLQQTCDTQGSTRPVSPSDAALEQMQQFGDLSRGHVDRTARASRRLPASRARLVAFRDTGHPRGDDLLGPSVHRAHAQHAWSRAGAASGDGGNEPDGLTPAGRPWEDVPPRVVRWKPRRSIGCRPVR